ncbi:MAG TPA: hypothetical protein VKU36_01240 [Candidatus Babeliales bacterium]|nr:hypothetical protein [Candidatus Babeliales bacterium]
MRLMVILIFLISIVHQLYAMKNALILENDHVNHHIVWDVIVSQSLLNDDYDTYRKIAVFNKAFHTFIENGYRPKKKLLDKFKEENKIDFTGYVSWNKDFSKCAWVTISEPTQRCALTLLGLDNKNSIITRMRIWENFYFPVFEDDIRPFFTKEEQACFHGYGYKGTLYNKGIYSAYGYGSVLEYMLDIDDQAEYRRCYIQINPLTYIPFSYIFNFPFLLKAFLGFKKRTYTGTYNYSDLLSFYDIHRITIPENYAVSQQHLGWKKTLDAKTYKYECDDNIIMYDKLPKNLRQAIDECYQKEAKEKSEIGKQNDERNDFS